MFRIKKNFINYILSKGKKNKSEKIYKNIFRQLLQLNKKNSKKFVQILVNYFLLIFKVKNHRLNNKLSFLLVNKIPFSISLIVDKFFKFNKMNILLNLKNLLLEKKNSQIQIFGYKKLLFFYRW